MNPRIYTYKITFPHQGWHYWGVHKERVYGELYYGSPVTHADKWENFEFEKQILEFFYDWDEARSVEKRLIKPDLNNPLCLNENAGGGVSLEILSRNGKRQGKNNVDSGQLLKIATPESRKKGGKAGGKIGGKTQGERNVKSGHLSSISSKGGKIRSKQLNSEKWRCLVTGFISSAGPLTIYQKARGIDNSLRERVSS